jgi:hypothetical protein
LGGSSPTSIQTLIEVGANCQDLSLKTRIHVRGCAFLIYSFWAVSPDFRTIN